MLADLHLGEEAAFLEVHRIDAHMNEHLRAVRCLQADGVPILRNAAYLTVKRGVKLIVHRVNGAARAQHLLAEHGIRNLGKRHDLPLRGGVYHALAAEGAAAGAAFLNVQNYCDGKGDNGRNKAAKAGVCEIVHSGV